MAELKTDSSAPRRCPRCGAELPASTPPDLCPRCLLQAALPTQIREPKTERMTETRPPSSRGLPRPGDPLGHYRILRLLGEGGMGAVFDAEDLENGRRVALKVLSQTLDSPEARERFFREGRMAASINHPNSVYVFGTEEIGGTPVIAMELVAGGTLQERVACLGPLPVVEAVDCGLQIIAGLEAAQRIGILHRDIKPSNCFRDAGGAVKIGDFGLSISTGVRTEPALTTTGIFLGTPAFCSPEQLRGDELNVHSDMYSVGATLFYLLTGHTPFEGKNTLQLMAAALEKPAPSPAKIRPGIPKDLAKVVLRCLEKQPGDRFKNYHDLGRALAPHVSAATMPATLGVRFLATGIDQTLLGVVWMSLMWLTGRSPIDFINLSGKALHQHQTLGMMLTIVATALAYYTVWEGLRGAAVGKTICRLRIVGPERNVPGLARAFLRTLIFVVLPVLPFWLIYAIDAPADFDSSMSVKYFASFSYYVILGLLFCTARRTNGFASVHDLISQTRVVSRTALELRPELPVIEMPLPTVAAGRTVGPYHVLETLQQSADTKWLLAYDLRLLRKVWIRVVPPGTTPVPTPIRNISRIGRLRWLTGRRSAEENWDAFEAASGRPLLSLVETPQPWSLVRFWLSDLAREINLASKDDTLPALLAMDRVWITGDGRAKLLDFPAPSLREPADSNPPKIRSSSGFLAKVAGTALAGGAGCFMEPGGLPSVPLPMHARDFLKRLPQLADIDSVIGALKPLLKRTAIVTRWRRAAIVVGCLVAPLFFGLSFIWGTMFLEQWNRNHPGLLDLSRVLQQRTAMSSGFTKDLPHPSDHQFAVYIASHYRPSSPMKALGPACLP